MWSSCCGLLGRSSGVSYTSIQRTSKSATAGLSNPLRHSSNSVRFGKLTARGEEATFVGPMHVQVPLADTAGKRVIIVGDVHGCVVELRALLQKLSFDSKLDYLCFVGDLVGKGPSSLEVVEFVRSLDGAMVVRGNHEQRVLRYAHGLETWRREPSTPSEHETLASRLSISDLEWFQTLPLSVHLQEHDVLVVHAGVPPGQAPDKTDPNLLMNIRNLTPSGEATSKSGVGSAWAQSWGGQPDIVFGHDAQRGYKVYDHAVGLDSGCVYGGSLTALLLPDRAVVAVPAVELHCDPHART